MTRRPQDAESSAPHGRRVGVWVGAIAAVALLLVAGGVATVYLTSGLNRGISGFDTASGLLLPRLSPDAAAEVTLERGDQRIVLVRQQNGWVLAGNDGFPASPGAVEDLLRYLATAEVQYVSSRPEPPEGVSYGFGDDRPGAVSVTVRNRDGRTLADLWIGQTINRHDAVLPYLVAVARKDDSRIRLVGMTGEIDVDPALERWTSTFLLHILAPRIVEAQAAAPDGETPLRVRRDEIGNLELPRGAPSPQQADAVQPAAIEVTRALEDVRFEDVRAAGSLPADANPVGTARYKTREGLGVDVRLLRDKRGAVWSTFHVKTEGGDSAEAEAKSLRERVDGWVFRIPQRSAERMIAARADSTR